MDVEYSLTLEDVRAFTSDSAKHLTGPSWKNVNHVSRWVFGTLILVWIASFLFEKDSRIQPALHTMILLLIGAWAGTILSALDILRASGGSTEKYFKDPRNRFLFGMRRLSISAEGVTVDADGFRDYLPWKAIIDVVVTAHHVFLYNGSIHAQVVPKHAFRDEQHFQEFIGLSRQYWQGWNQQATKQTGIIAGLPPQSDAFTRPDDTP